MKRIRGFCEAKPQDSYTKTSSPADWYFFPREHLFIMSGRIMHKYTKNMYNY